MILNLEPLWNRMLHFCCLECKKGFKFILESLVYTFREKLIKPSEENVLI